MVVADAQTAGRGRMGRRWESPAGENLYFSVLLTPNVEPARVPQLALVAAVAVHEGLAECCPDIVAQIKWPNDILVGGRKVAGILCEASLEADRVHRVILGIGINVNGASLPRALRDDRHHAAHRGGPGGLAAGAPRRGAQPPGGEVRGLAAGRESRRPSRLLRAALRAERQAGGGREPLGGGARDGPRHHPDRGTGDRDGGRRAAAPAGRRRAPAAAGQGRGSR